MNVEYHDRDAYTMKNWTNDTSLAFVSMIFQKKYFSTHFLQQNKAMKSFCYSDLKAFDS